MKFTFVTRLLMISLVLATAVLWSSWVASPTSSASLVAQHDCSTATLSPTSFFFPVGGGTGRITINNGQGCFLNATSNVSFIVVTSISQQNGTIDFSVSANNSGPPRNGTITIDLDFFRNTVPVSQQGSAPLSLYRYWNAGTYNHYYTTDFSELGNGANGYVFERVEGHVYGSQVSGTVPLKRYYCADNGDHFYTTNPNEPGAGLPCYQFERVEAYVFPNKVSGTVALYRYYEPNNYDHFYTTNFNELRNGGLGWYLEGVQCYVFPP